MKKEYWVQIAIGLAVGIVVGAILGIASMFYVNAQRIARLEERVAQTQSPVAVIDEAETLISDSAAHADRSEKAVQPEILTKIIQDSQRENVRESFGEMSGQCFTENDLNNFIGSKRPFKIAEDLRTDKTFLAAVLSLQKMSPQNRQNFLNSANKPLRPTWEELGEISANGQTDAGQKAEKLIAEEIITQVKVLLALPVKELQRLYEQ